MHARPTRPRLNRSIKMCFHESDYLTLERAAGEHDLGPFCRDLVLGQVTQSLPGAERLILAEVCALRKQLEDLLQLISDLTDADIAHARHDADRLRPALVRERIVELREAQEAPALA